MRARRARLTLEDVRRRSLPYLFHNRSKVVVPRGAARIFSYGIKFIPSPNKELILDSHNYLFRLERNLASVVRTMGLRSVFGNGSRSMEFYTLLSKNPSYQPAVINYVDSATIESFRTHSNAILDLARDLDRQWSARLNVKPSEVKEAVDILQNREVTLLAADKNMGLTLVDRDWVTEAISYHLDDPTRYAEINTSSPLGDEFFGPLYKDIKEFMETAYQLDRPMRSRNAHWTRIPSFITGSIPDTYEKLVSDFTFNTVKLLPKLHKPKFDRTTSRLITASQKSPFQNFAKFLARLLDPAVKTGIPTNLRDTTELILALEKIKFNPGDNVVIVTADATNLYGFLQWDLVCFGIESALKLYKAHDIFHPYSIGEIIRLATIANSNCYVEFGGRLMRQILGIAMGTSDGVHKATLAIGAQEVLMRERFPSLFECVALWKRFIDDLFMILVNPAPGTLERIKFHYREFTKVEWNFQTVEFEAGYGGISPALPFLDLEIYVRFLGMGHKTYFKPSHLGPYIPPNSLHDPKSFIGWITSEITRLARNCMEPLDFYDARKKFFHWLLARGYNKQKIGALFFGSHEHFKSNLDWKRKARIPTLQSLAADRLFYAAECIYLPIPFGPGTRGIKWTSTFNRLAVENNWTIRGKLLQFRTAWTSLTSLGTAIDILFQNRSGDFNPNPNGFMEDPIDEEGDLVSGLIADEGNPPGV